MNKKLIEMQDAFLYNINQVCSKLGLNNIMAQLYAILYLSDKPLSLDDMVERLKISKASVSVNIRALERYNAVKKVWVKKSRKDYYEADIDIAKVVRNRVRSMAQSRLSEIGDMINTSYETLNSISSSDKSEKDDVKIFVQRLNKLKDLHGKAKTVLNFI